MRAVVAGLQLHAGQLRLGVGRQQFVDLLRGDLGRGGVGPEVDARLLVAPAAKERDLLIEDAGRKGADAALLDLRAVDALERKSSVADVVEHLDGVAVDRIDLVAQLDQSHHGIGVGLAGAVLQRVDGERVVEVRDHQKLTVGGHPVAIHPAHIDHDAEVGVGVLRERAAVPKPQFASRRDAQQVEGVVERDLPPVVAHIPQHRYCPVSGHRDELGAHHAIADVVPVDAAAVDARPRAVGDDALSRTQVGVADPAAVGRRDEVDRVARAQVAGLVGVDAAEDGDLGHAAALALPRFERKRLARRAPLLVLHRAGHP